MKDEEGEEQGRELEEHGMADASSLAWTMLGTASSVSSEQRPGMRTVPLLESCAACNVLCLVVNVQDCPHKIVTTLCCNIVATFTQQLSQVRAPRL